MLHKHQLLWEIALRFVRLPAVISLTRVYYPPRFLAENAHPSLRSLSPRSWCLRQSTWMATSWRSPTTCLCTITPSTGGGLDGSILRKVRPLIWNMVGTPFSLVSVAALIVNLFAFLSSHSTTLPVAGVVFAGPRELELALSSNLSRG